MIVTNLDAWWSPMTQPDRTGEPPTCSHKFNLRAQLDGTVLCHACGETWATWAALSPSRGAAAGEPSEVHGIVFVLLFGGEVLLEQCPRKREILGVGEWFVPGGKLEQDESAAEAFLREMREELGVAPLTFKALPIIEGSPIPPTSKGVFLMRPYVVTSWRGDLPTHTLDQQTPLCWVPVEEALRSPVPQVRAMVAMAIGAAALRAPAEGRGEPSEAMEKLLDEAFSAYGRWQRCAATKGQHTAQFFAELTAPYQRLVRAITAMENAAPPSRDREELRADITKFLGDTNTYGLHMAMQMATDLLRRASSALMLPAPPGDREELLRRIAMLIRLEKNTCSGFTEAVVNDFDLDLADRILALLPAPPAGALERLREALSEAVAVVEGRPKRSPFVAVEGWKAALDAAQQPAGEREKQT